MRIRALRKIPNSLARARIKGGWPGQMRCSNMAADSKTEKKLGHNLTVTRYVPSASSLYTILKKPPISGHLLTLNSGHFVLTNTITSIENGLRIADTLISVHPTCEPRPQKLRFARGSA